MTLTLYAQPYDMDATGFYFEDADSFRAKAASCKNSYGQPVEEFEFQFIEGSEIDCAFAESFWVNQDNYAAFFKYAEEWDHSEKIYFIIAVGECGYSFDHKTVGSYDFDIDLYESENMREFAETYAGDWLLCDVPESLKCYIDYEALAHDLAVEYCETTVAGTRYVYRCG